MTLLTTRQVAERMAIDVGKVTRWIKAGELKAIDVSQTRGGKPRYRIPENELERFIHSRSTLPSKPSKRNRRTTKRVYT